MKKIALLYLIFAISALAKRVTHRQKFADVDWVYTSKFGASANSMVNVSFNSRVLNYVRE